jgi:hypothetical protein
MNSTSERLNDRWKRLPDVAPVSAERVAALRRHWLDGWNGEDVDTIVAPFHRDIVFSSPFVSRITGDPKRTSIRGLDAVRQYCADSFVRATRGIRYSVDFAYAGTVSVVLQYTVHHPALGDLRGVDTMRLDPEGKVIEWHCHYDFEP